MRPGAIVAGVLTLIVLETLGRRADEAGKGLLWLSDGLKRLISPDVALIPRHDRVRKGAGTVPKEGSKGLFLPRNPTLTA